MTTAEFIIGHSADDAVERRQEIRKILWALLAALCIHLVIAYVVAVFSGMLSSPITSIEEDKPVELTFVDLATPAPKNAMFMETDESKQSVQQPEEKTFESNANSIAASQLPPSGNIPLPSQQGRDQRSVDLETHQYALATEGAQPQPPAQPQQTPQPSQPPQSTPQSTPVSEPEQFALLTSTPTPAIQPTAAATPQKPKSSYRDFRQKTKIAGSISNRGISSVNAIGTPLGRYEKIMKDAIGSRWYAFMERNGDLAPIGTLQVHFLIDQSGHVRNLKITENSSGSEAYANICLRAIQEANLPPIPSELANTLPPEGLEIDGMSFIYFPN